MKLRIPISFVAAIFGAVTYVTFAILAGALYPLPISPMRNWLSDLGNQIVNPQGQSFITWG